MRVGEVCNREVVVIDKDESVKVAAELMRRYHVGNVVVVEGQGGRRMPVGIVTDRDLVLKVLLPGLAPEDLAVRDVASAPLATVASRESLFVAMEIMEAKAVRRLPVVEDDGSLGGILTVDDLSELLTGLQGQLAGVVNRQRQKEARKRS